MDRRRYGGVAALAMTAVMLVAAPHAAQAAGLRHRQESLKTKLAAEPLKIAWECYVNNNWEIFVMNADGTHKVNLTNTPNVNEHYPQISPDGKKIAFSVDSGSGRDAVRSLWVMDTHGKHRRKIADHAREPFWAPDSQTIGYLHQEYPRFDVMDFYTDGMAFYNLATGATTPHPNTAKLHHLYNPGFSKNGKWIVATVHAGMGYGHTILLIEAHGNKIIDLKIPGCRPRLCSDNQHIAWGSSDHQLDVAPIDLNSDNPTVGPWSLQIHDEKNKIYHIAWSPDGRYVAFSRGPDSDGDLTKPGTFTDACEIVGVYAKGWDVYAVSAQRTGSINLEKATDADVVQLTSNGDSNKQPVWFRKAR